MAWHGGVGMVWVVAGLHAPASEEGTPEDYAFDRG
jgi:hypothetical protein